MAKKSSSSPVKTIMMVLLVVLFVGGGVIAAVYFQVLNVPGLEFISKLSQPPKKAKVVAKKEDPVITPPVSAPKKEVKKAVPAQVPVLTDPKKGAKQTAKLWNQIETPRLVEIVKNWPNPELAKVIMQMDTGQASALLSALDPTKSADLSKIIQEESSKVSLSSTSL